MTQPLTRDHLILKDLHLSFTDSSPIAQLIGGPKPSVSCLDHSTFFWRKSFTSLHVFHLFPTVLSRQPLSALLFHTGLLACKEPELEIPCFFFSSADPLSISSQELLLGRGVVLPLDLAVDVDFGPNFAALLELEIKGGYYYGEQPLLNP